MAGRWAGGHDTRGRATSMGHSRHGGHVISHVQPITYISAKIGRAGGKSKNAKTGASGGAVELDAKLGQGGGGYYPTMSDCNDCIN